MTSSVKNSLLTTIVFLLVLSGCVTPFPPTQTESPTEFYHGTVRMFYWNESIDPYYENVSVSLTAERVSRYSDDTFDDVMFCVYDEDGNVIESVNVGSINKSGGVIADIVMYTNVSTIENRDSRFVDIYLQLNQTPAYYLPYHPEFESHNIANNNLAVRGPAGYNSGASISTFPYPLPEKQGTCEISNNTIPTRS